MASGSLLQLRFMARRLRVTARWLREEAEAGRVPHVRAGDQFLFNPEAVEQLLAERATREGLRADERELAHA